MVVMKEVEIGLVHELCPCCQVPLRTIESSGFADFIASTLHAWRARTIGGQLLLESSHTAKPSDGSPSVLHILECEPNAHKIA